jgi:hypothetical protein
MLDLSHEPDLGYVFYPHETPDHAGFPRLDLIIPAKPTYRHFDPQNVRFQVVSPTRDIDHISVHHPWTLGDSYQVCAGRIFVADRNAKQFEAFSFGGRLEILSDTNHTVCALQSAAPIFQVTLAHDLPQWIVVEAEILLAQQRAHWDPQHPHAFETHLATVDPLILYASCLQAIEAKATHMDNGATELDRHGFHFVQTEIKWLKNSGKWPLVLPSLDELFAQ